MRYWPKFPSVIPHNRAGSHALLTRAPLTPGPKPKGAFDLHVLSMPPAFVLSQDQTLMFILSHPPRSPQGATRLTGPPNARTTLPVRARSSTIAPPPAH